MPSVIIKLKKRCKKSYLVKTLKFLYNIFFKQKFVKLPLVLVIIVVVNLKFGVTNLSDLHRAGGS